MPALTLLDAVRWRGEPVVGARAQSLLATLVDDVGEQTQQRLVETVWGDDPPAHPAKALQVLVSRVRSACGPEVVVSTPRGYRLGLDRVDVDALVLLDLVAAAERAHASGDDAEAAALSGRALDVGAATAGDGAGALDALRRRACTARTTAVRLHAVASSTVGEHAAALAPLERLAAADPDDEEVLEHLLRSEAEVRGPAAALERYERHRERVADRLGTEPGERVRAVHRELLAKDAPVRSGLVFDGTDLVGREDDVRALRALLARARVTSIVGPGGLGKTRLAQLLARTAEQPVVHVVELVGTTSPDDVVGEVGSALGVRESVAGRRALTPEQRADVRSRIAQQLATAPSLLVLDNCEHVVEAVADLVAFVVASTRDVRVLTTSRAPLGIAAEHVYPLGTLTETDATDLFRQRAVAARLSAALDAGVVTALVERLDGLPLAIELAAARVRAMTVEEVLSRLDDRFALLRGGDRAAPDRHQTLLAVIDWSWNLLGAAEQRALRRLAVFHDGFSLEAAERVLDDPDAHHLLASLAAQSLVDVRDVQGAVRYRMLETIREFGLLRLDASGERDDAVAAHRAWAVDLARRVLPDLDGPDEARALDRLRLEEANLADVLRGALSSHDAATAVGVLVVLTRFWSVVGQHHRLVTMGRAIGDALVDWEPPDELADVTRDVVAECVSHATVFGMTLPVLDLLRRLGDGGTSPRSRALVRLVLVADGTALDAETLLRLAGDGDRHVASLALRMASHLFENEGEADAAVDAAERALALWQPEDGPFAQATMHGQLAGLSAQRGDLDGLEVHAAAALGPLRELGAVDDVVQCESALAMAMIARGDVDEAARRFAAIRFEDSRHSFGGGMMAQTGWAEVALARGDGAEGVRLYDRAVRELEAQTFPGFGARGFEPWVLVVEASSLSAHAGWAPADDPVGVALASSLRDKLVRIVSGETGFVDYPIAGLVLSGLARWHFRRGAEPELVARLLVHADAFGPFRLVLSVWRDGLEAALDEESPGALERARPEVAGRRAPELRDAVVALLGQLPAADGAGQTLRW